MKKSIVLRGFIFFLVFAASVGIAYYLITANNEKKIKTLKVFNPTAINKALVDSSVQNVNQNHKIGAFELTNQNGEIITEEIFEGKIYIADFFFTTCTNICPIMTENMRKVAEQYKDQPLVKFISHSVTPKIDSVEVLRNYANEYKVEDEQWQMVTGDKKHIYNLARKNYFAATTEGSGGEDDFIHTENFVLIDINKRIRGFYDGTSEEDIERLIAEIGYLLKETKGDTE